MKLQVKKKKLLREFVGYICEQCHKPESEVGTLEIHRINRGYLNGAYQLRNIMCLCKKCHKLFHAYDFKQTRR
jgi:hypothetical protein